LPARARLFAAPTMVLAEVEMRFSDDLRTWVQVRRFHPFGDGIRSCIGQSLARMNMPTAVALLVSAFRFEMDDSVRPIMT
jgi:cytochrome P450